MSRGLLAQREEVVRTIGAAEDRGEPAHMQLIADSVKWSGKGNLSRMLRRLRADGLIAPGDAAEVTWQLTESGIDCYRELTVTRWERFRRYSISRAEAIVVAIATAVAVLAVERALGLRP